ncbi:Protein of unknown function [Pyronema omphalodes CBS 100304]|uniref:Uncharacterized protein n=1 Tax=Pyronema omphalodes (strain CBS 100304) TaxID=1076935 RepID=U4L4F3_PYROM|nr:Protein of unknown function [Pyronema omphalodes CBS 100304]
MHIYDLIEAQGHNKTISDKNHINYDGVFAGVAFILAGLIMLGSTVYVFKLIVDKIFASFVLHGRQLHQDLAAAYGSCYYKETDWNPNKTNERTRMLLDEEVLAAMDAANKAAVHAAMRAALERSQILVPSEGGPFPRFAGPDFPLFSFLVVDTETMLAKVRETIAKEEAKAYEKASQKA